ncbi:MAG: hypothetical protein WA702_10195 [Bradyrhizobium sp.]|uniref:hypothetical protein n=1 Tax=Bradyrhizobium sp. TaxID=376 RepID=UPI003C7AAA92
MTHGFKAEKMSSDPICDERLRSMLNDQSGNDVEALGRPRVAATDNDRDLLTLETQLDDLITQLHAAQQENGLPMVSSEQPSVIPDGAGDDTEGESVSDAQTKQVEIILERLYPIERAIMAAPACSIIGLGVKARHAAYAMSQYWEESTDKIDWEAQIIRLLIEAVCDVAHKPLSFSKREK